MNARPPRRALLTAILLATATLGCAGGAPQPSATTPPGPVTSPQDAVARVIGSEPRLASITPFDAGLIGQSSWYTVDPASGVGAYVVGIRIGWGDCPAGCINRHHWFYTVTNDGTVTFDKEDGPAVPSGVPGTAIDDRAPAPTDVIVEAGMAVVELSYDTGIR